MRATAWLHMPTASATILMPGCLAKTSFAALVRSVSTEVPGHAGDDDDIALAAELLDQPFGGLASGLFLIDVDIVGARLGDLGVIGEDLDALVAGVLDDLVQGGRRNREDHDRLGAGLHHGVDLLNLPLRVGSGDLHLEATLSAKLL